MAVECTHSCQPLWSPEYTALQHTPDGTGRRNNSDFPSRCTQPFSHPSGSPYKWVHSLKVQEVSPGVGSGLPLSQEESSRRRWMWRLDPRTLHLTRRPHSLGSAWLPAPSSLREAFSTLGSREKGGGRGKAETEQGLALQSPRQVSKQ